MNKRTAKTIRKFVARNSDPKLFKHACKVMKRKWNKLPRNERHAMREEME